MIQEDDFIADDFQPDGGDDFVADDFQPDAAPAQKKGIFRRGLEAVAKSDALPIAGGIIGGVAGAPLGPGAIGTAAFGGAAGEAWRQNLSRGLGMNAPQTSGEAAKDIGVAGAVQAAGEAGGLALRPISKAVKMIPGVKPLLRGVKKTAGDVFQLATKIRPDDAGTLFRNPGAILPGTMKEASEHWRTAAQNAGLPVNEISPEMLRILKGDAKQMVFETYEKMISGVPVSAREAQLAKQALDIGVMPVAKTVRKNPLVNTLNQMRTAFMERIGQESPEMAAANKEYAIAATGRKFRSLFPRNTTGDPAYFRSSILPAAGLLESFRDGDPSAVLKATAAQGVMSPLAMGGLIAGAGKLANPTIRRILTATASQKILGKRNSRPSQPIDQTINRNSQTAENNDNRGNGAEYQQNNGAYGADQATPKRILGRKKELKVLSEQDARRYLNAARGDRNTARRMAISDGWTIPE